MFAEIAWCPDYLASSDGKIWSKKHKKMKALAGGIDKDGYRKVILCKDGVRRYARVATLILEAFVGPKPEGMEVAHKNGKNDDDRLENLRWDTHRNNVADKKTHGTHQAGEKHGSHVLTESDVRAIRSRRENGESLQSIADDFPVTVSQIWSVCNGRAWNHVS